MGSQQNYNSGAPGGSINFKSCHETCSSREGREHWPGDTLKERGHLDSQQCSKQVLLLGLFFLLLYWVIEPERLGCSFGKKGRIEPMLA